MGSRPKKASTCCLTASIEFELRWLMRWNIYVDWNGFDTDMDKINAIWSRVLINIQTSLFSVVCLISDFESRAALETLVATIIPGG